MADFRGAVIFGVLYVGTLAAVMMAGSRSQLLNPLLRLYTADLGPIRLASAGVVAACVAATLPGPWGTAALVTALAGAVATGYVTVHSVLLLAALLPLCSLAAAAYGGSIHVRCIMCRSIVWAYLVMVALPGCIGMWFVLLLCSLGPNWWIPWTHQIPEVGLGPWQLQVALINLSPVSWILVGVPGFDVHTVWVLGLLAVCMLCVVIGGMLWKCWVLKDALAEEMRNTPAGRPSPWQTRAIPTVLAMAAHIPSH